MSETSFALGIMASCSSFVNESSHFPLFFVSEVKPSRGPGLQWQVVDFNECLLYGGSVIVYTTWLPSS